MTLLSDQADAVRALVESADPGAVWAVGGPDGPYACSGGADDVLDAGGLTAVLALWPTVGTLVDEGALRLHTPLAAYGDEAAAGTPAGTTAHQLLTHPGGTAALTRLVEHLCGSTLAEAAATRVWRPLGMTRTRLADGTLRAPLADLALFLRHLLHPSAPSAPSAANIANIANGSNDPGDTSGPAPLTRAWTAESLRIRTGELTPARGLLWHPAPHGVWTHHAPADPGPAVWISPRHHRWAVLLPAAPGPLRTTFREAVFTPAAPARSSTSDGVPRV
ncbi:MULTISPECIES: hypothetical protein [Streptomyces]|uniref:hypothetical protein n=1 Tax=Streptomyces TaxID=1883 RepID=UPI0006ADA7AE|nr:MULTISPECIES: hypothetical protein [unclassified Streptomyces]KOV08185.1 hypothetical protein ADK92_03910 [Streptomyces sp. XY533]QNE23762.1 beta-lactamase family protein [Streptomyces sp. INR7]